MTSLTTVKHQIAEVDGVRCTLIESGVTRERMEFLRDLLTYNNLDVKIKEVTAAEGNNSVLFTVGVTDIVFNPVYAIYERRLIKPDGELVTPAFWRQHDGDTSVQYWLYGKTVIPDLYE